ncbi:sulfite exporter TauE/SafE family protein [Lacimicrobium alkaliphilum]|uniref:Probable membrane transporter protein n=1 Tax=Lacimicrobium alkaliphilum TaxID=1526571 RepID=A0A0U2ZL68_9ALTE|nr:sulfite exporter TauE/SafE family protein [Lacimicrobium alkaliphilum]ALS99751.1 hypothetical protein AT746_16740 [Lacimicrobium alkaliphilum]
MSDLLLINLVLLCGACLQGLLGFGLGLFCAPLLFLIAPEYVPAPMILNALLLTFLISVTNREAIDTRLTAFAIVGGTIGVSAAGGLMWWLDTEHYPLLFGILIILAVLLSFLGVRPAINRRTNLIAGALSGFMGTTTSAGGAPMGLLYQDAEHSEIKANLSVFFLYINLFGICLLWLTGIAGQGDLLLFLQSVPALLLGWWMSWYLGKRINAYYVRYMILLVALCAGILSVLM